MKKYLSILMVIAVLFSFAACSNNAKSTKTETTANTTEMQKTENTEAWEQRQRTDSLRQKYLINICRTSNSAILH